jgi:hypothetical protein
VQAAVANPGNHVIRRPGKRRNYRMEGTGAIPPPVCAPGQRRQRYNSSRRYNYSWL